MSDQELEGIIQKIYLGKLEEYREDDMEATFHEWHELRPPAKPEDIAACERLLGRAFSPSYRHFLRLHDGWKGFYMGAGIGYLYGTHHYRFNSEGRDDFALTAYVDISWGLTTYEAIQGAASEDASGKVTGGSAQPAPVPEHPHPLYYPENYYPFIDGRQPDPEYLKPVRKLIDGYVFDERTMIFPAWKHTLIGSEAHYRLLLDAGTLRPDGEMDVVELEDGGVSRWGNFYEFIQDWARQQDKGRAQNPFFEGEKK